MTEAWHVLLLGLGSFLRFSLLCFGKENQIEHHESYEPTNTLQLQWSTSLSARTSMTVRLYDQKRPRSHVFLPPIWVAAPLSFPAHLHETSATLPPPP